jgi:alpha-beta hydrolase superfamily lysophospholipase
MASPFVVVLCHGSCHTPAPYQPLVDALTERGIETYCPQRPTCDLSQLNVGDINNPDFDRRAPPGGYPLPADDAAEIGRLIDRLIADGKSVLLAGHSSGGWVAAEAATSARQASVRAKEGKTGGIIGIFFIGAFIIPEGQSVHSFFQPADGRIIAPPFMRFHVGLPSVIPVEHTLTICRNTVWMDLAQWSTLRNSSSMISTRRPLRNGRVR